jgi:AcrR family transcriptional regulator
MTGVRRPPEVRREQLLDAAEAVLLEHGARAMTMAEVARRAGLAKGTTYLYFDSKDALLAALRARYVAGYGAAAAAPPGAGARDRLRLLVTGLVEYSAARRELHHRLFHEAGVPEEGAFGTLRDELVAVLRDGASSGELWVDDLDTTAAFLLHGIHGVLSGHHRSGPAPAALVADLVERSLTWPPAPVRPARPRQGTRR